MYVDILLSHPQLTLIKPGQGITQLGLTNPYQTWVLCPPKQIYLGPRETQLNLE